MIIMSLRDGDLPSKQSPHFRGGLLRKVRSQRHIDRGQRAAGACLLSPHLHSLESRENVQDLARVQIGM